MNLWYMFRAITKRKWIVFAALAITTGSAVFCYHFLPNYYQATVIMMPSVRALRSGMSSDPTQQLDSEQKSEQIATLLEMAKSRAVCERAAMKLHYILSPVELQSRAQVMRVTDSQVGRETNLIRLRVSAQTPSQAVLAANALSRSFVEFYDRISHKEAAENRKFLEEQLTLARDRLNDAEAGLRQFNNSKRIVSLQTQQQAAVTSLAALISDRDATNARISELSGQLQAIIKQLAVTPKTRKVAETTTDGSASSQLKAQIAEMEKELSLLRSRYTDKHPKVSDLESTLAQARQELKNISHTAVSKETIAGNPAYEQALLEQDKLQAEYKALSSRLDTLNATIIQRESELKNYPGTNVELDRRELEFKTAQDAYTTTLSQLNQARMGERLTTETGAIQILDYASRAEGPLSNGPNFVQLIIASIIIGLSLGIGIAALLESADRSSRTSYDAPYLAEMPVIGVIPPLSHPTPGSMAAKMSMLEPMSAYSEAFRFIAADIMSNCDGESKSIMGITNRSGQGGTAVVCNIAITLAQAGKKVILIDANMRNPRVHAVFDLENQMGLSDYINGNRQIQGVINKTNVDNLSVVVSGSLPGNPWQLLRSQRFIEMISILKERCDYILLDTPSASQYADAISVSEAVDAAVVVVSPGNGYGDADTHFINSLGRFKATILGVTINGSMPGPFYYRSGTENILQRDNENSLSGQGDGSQKSICASNNQ